MSAQPFKDKIILITGAGSGIGRGTSIKLSSLGATLALSDINSTSVSETLTLCSTGDHSTFAFDVGSTEAANAFVSEVMAKYGQIDHIFNCAGVNPTTLPTAEIEDEYWDKLINTNMKGMFNITRACIPHLKSGASFVNVSSICGLQPSAGFAVYCASKYGVIGFSKCIALELGPKGIRTNIIAPGYIDTPTNASVVAGKESVERMVKGVSLGRIGTPEDIADVVAFLFSEESRYMNGSVVEITGGIK
jgi:NAD(P)-dependent dehydrogenase (short-subunit alcohol dehydrogenase family)